MAKRGGYCKSHAVQSGADMDSVQIKYTNKPRSWVHVPPMIDMECVICGTDKPVVAFYTGEK